jgi:hypothetical protein
MSWRDVLNHEGVESRPNDAAQRSERQTGGTNCISSCTTQAEAAVNKVMGLDEKRAREEWARFHGDAVRVRGENRDVDEFFDDNRKMGIGGAPTRCSILPTSPADRKKYPVASGVLDYFPDAIAAISNLSWVGNNQHNPGQPLHWARGKSTDESDTMLRHFLQRGTVDSDGVRHSVKMAWRALALLQKELEG